MFQTKQQDKNLRRRTIEVDVGSLPKKEFRVVITKMVKEFSRMDTQSKKLEVLNKSSENMKNNQTEIKNTTTEVKNTVDRVNSRLNDTEEQSGKLENRVVKITDAEQKKKK